jgi:hypothetical protein
MYVLTNSKEGTKCFCSIIIVATLALGLWPRCEFARGWAKRRTHECGRVWEWTLTFPNGLPKLQRVIAKGKTPHLEKFFISLENYWSVDVQNGLAWPIWTFETQVMAKTKAGSQIGSLIPNHGKSGINPIPLHSGCVQHTVGKLSMRATTSVQTPSWSKFAQEIIVPQLCETPSLGDFGTPIWKS